ncbi:hypothetical protein BJ742DRAFT_900939 [Cladochytrium replicatum]|nr:hypothetical protein BJ742DRAFT_900939 [Cladochytrium replicatum]
MNPHNQYVEEDSLELPTPVPTSSIPSVPSSSSTAHTHLNYGNVYVATQYNESSYQPPPYNPAQVPPSKWMETAPPSHGETQKPTESNPKKSRALMYWVIIGFAVVIIVVLAVLLASKPWDQKSSGNGNGNGDANVVSGTSSASATARSTINNGVDRSTSLGTIPIATTNIPQTITTNDPQAITTAARTTTTTNTAASSPAAQRSCLMSDFT